ncbi:hypothetical protein NX005_26450, partial [Escherichia coli]|nr:hypothetical protein [Escherichia coli]
CEPMIFPCPPITFICTNCQWSKTIIHMNCTAGFYECPVCGEKVIYKRKATITENLFARAIQLFLKK